MAQHRIQADVAQRARLSPLDAHPLVPLNTLLPQARAALTYAVASADNEGPLRVFFAMGDGRRRAVVVHFSGKCLDTIWAAFDAWRSAQPKPDPSIRWLRVDWVTRSWNLPWDECQQAIRSSKRNYFRYGLALDPDFSLAFLEQELNANAMLYLGHKEPAAGLNPKNFGIYGRRRFGESFALPTAQDARVMLFTTDAFLIQADCAPVPLHGFSGGSEGRDTGRRRLDTLDAATVETMVDQSSCFLAAQIDEKGQFTYGLHPCFDREINAYNTLRHASTVYAMLEAWEVTRDPSLWSAIERALNLLTERLVRSYTLPDGQQVAYLRDLNNEIKLGGSAVCLLALVTFTELTGDKRHLALLKQLAQGIVRLQDPETGQFAHVLNADDLSVKEQFRIIYYDGEAAFGLMRLYGLTQDPRWLATVEKAFDYFIEQEHWRTHDHWLSYCVNELTLYRPEEKYYRFGLMNVADHLDFVIDRITTFPTLLELMMAAHKMIRRLECDETHRHLLKHLDQDKFYRALETRARYLANGFFWPEMAMFFRNPQRILGSFFIRHHAFRIRIDDVEHYLSGYVAYLKHYLRAETRPLPSGVAQSGDQPRPLPLTADAVIAWGGAVNLGQRQHLRTGQLGPAAVLNIPELRHADLSVVNLDCAVSTFGRQGVDKGEAAPFYRRARPEMLHILTNAGVNAVTMGNAHSGDYGPTALIQQTEILDKIGIRYTGAGATVDNALRPMICTAGDTRVAILSVDTIQHRSAATDSGPGTAFLCPNETDVWHSRMTALIAQARENADVVLVTVHWGAKATPTPDSKMRRLSRALIDLGADGVLGVAGQKPHGIEIYRSKPIIHGTGTLLAEAPRPWFRPGGLFRLGLGAAGIRWIEYIPIGIGYGFSERLDGEMAAQELDRYESACSSFGTTLVRQGHQAFVDLGAADASPTLAAPAVMSSRRYHMDALAAYAPDATAGQASFVPGNARIADVPLNGQRLLGVRLNPSVIIRRQMLWVETWWSVSKPVMEDLRISLMAIPRGRARGDDWGAGSDHDPCDWMQPTRAWQVGQIYYDHYGLRPPPLDRIGTSPLQLEIRVTGRSPSSECYLHPRIIPVRIVR